eukprot:Skav229328  [mRNA]  locus=scaffold2917:25234:26190:- [translate_table: standard]
MRIHGGKRPVRAILVALPLLFLVHFAWWFVIRSLGVVLFHTWEFLPMIWRMLVVSGAVFVVFAVTYPCQSLIGAQMTWNLQDLVAKLSSFKVQEAKCHCCSSGHKTPSGDSIPCDRELIYQSFLAWYQDADLQAGLDMFNMDVRNKYRHQILETCGGSRMIPLDLFIYVVFSTCTPFLIRNIPLACAKAEEESADGWLAVLVVMRDLVVGWGWMLPSILIYLWTNKIAWSYHHRQSMLTRSISAAFAVIFSVGVGFVARSSELWVPGNNWIPFVAHAFLMFLGVCLLLQPRCPEKEAQEVPDLSPEKDIDEQSDSFSI